MVLNVSTAKRTAELLLQINAIKLNPKNPFTWASGWKSPIYCDNRVLLSYPDLRKEVANAMAAQIKQVFPSAEIVAAVATGAIGIGMLVADIMNLPMIYVRPEPKKHGQKNQIEGHFSRGHKAVVIEDLISTGKSSLNAVEALRDNEINPLGMTAVFSYEFETAQNNFKSHHCPLYTLTNYIHLIDLALETGYIQPSETDALTLWRTNPENYSSK